MKRLLSISAVSFLIFFLASASAEKVVIKHALGEVLAIDIASKSLTIKKKSMEVSFFIDEKTIVKQGKEKKAVSDIKIGDMVVVKYFEKEGVKTTSIIEIKPPKPLPADGARPTK
ncbi:MAG: hypothetical protein LLF86_01795 [Nitrospiraceae bacterium]|nr:hypothetical protein [Nitrospiraceae bacterium]